MFYLTTHSTHFKIFGEGMSEQLNEWTKMYKHLGTRATCREVRKEIFYLTTH